MAPRADFSDATKLIGATEAEVSILIGIHHVVQFGQWHSSTLGSGDGRRQKKKNLDNSVDDQRGCSDSIASSAPTWTSSVKQRQKLNFLLLGASSFRFPPPPAAVQSTGSVEDTVKEKKSIRRGHCTLECFGTRAVILFHQNCRVRSARPFFFHRLMKRTSRNGHNTTTTGCNFDDGLG